MWNRLGIAVVFVSGIPLIAAVSRPAASVWVAILPWMFFAATSAAVTTIALVVVLCGFRSDDGSVATVTRWSSPFVLLPLVFVVVHLMTFAAGAFGLRLTESRFVDFADRVTASEEAVPTSDFRIGPWTYDSLCVSGDDVVVWHSDDSFFTVSALKISEGDVTHVVLQEGDGAFPCDHRRTTGR